MPFLSDADLLVEENDNSGRNGAVVDRWIHVWARGRARVAGRAELFCTLATPEDAYFGSDFRRLKSSALAHAGALLVTQELAEFDLIDLSRSICLTTSIGIAMLAIACGARLEFTMTAEWLPAIRRLFGASA